MTSPSDVCDRGHPIVRNRIILLGHIVGVCPTCGHRYLHSSLPSTYSYDDTSESGEKFHVYSFLAMLLCEECHSPMTSISIACQSHEDHEEVWRKELDENLHSSPDQQS